MLGGIVRWFLSMAIFLIALAIDGVTGNLESGFPLFTVIASIIAGVILINYHKKRGTLWWLLALILIKIISSILN
mgnify:CR=1 FL=1